MSGSTSETLTRGTCGVGIGRSPGPGCGSSTDRRSSYSPTSRPCSCPASRPASPAAPSPAARLISWTGRDSDSGSGAGSGWGPGPGPGSGSGSGGGTAAGISGRTAVPAGSSSAVPEAAPAGGSWDAPSAVVSGASCASSRLRPNGHHQWRFFPCVEPVIRTLSMFAGVLQGRLALVNKKEKPPRSREGFPTGGSDRRRSGDLSIFSRTLYQLSYRASGPAIKPDLATPTGLEPATSAVTGRRANQLRYGAIQQVNDLLSYLHFRAFTRSGVVPPTGFEPVSPP